ncbi:unnamed protein product [Symbiodinium sp. CCMP2456]|nr:unnamed protein product [Symbiodinium sp. CCMP2456]
MGHLQLKLENELRFSLLAFSSFAGFGQAFGVALSLGPDSKSTGPPGALTVYPEASATGGSRSLLGNVTVGANSFDISADFPLENYTHVLVYTRSDFGESSIAEAVPVVDVFSRVTDLDFVDKDLDAEQLGGFVRWIAPADVSQVRASG